MDLKRETYFEQLLLGIEQNQKQRFPVIAGTC